jgi:hypothetical protein
VFWLVGQRSDVRVGMFRQCFVVSSCLLFGRSTAQCADWDVQRMSLVSSCLWFGQSAVRWADWDVQTKFCGEQLPFGWSVSGPMGRLGFSDSV